MEPLATTKWVMTWMSFYPASETSNTQQKIMYKASGLAIFIIDMFSVIFYSAFIWKFAATDLEASLFAFTGDCAVCASLYTIPIAYFYRYRARRIFEQLIAIYDLSKHTFYYS